MIRNATPADAARIAEIYAPYVTDSAVSFEETPPDEVEIARRIEKAHLWLVDEVDGVVGGYAYGTPWRMRQAYRFTVETTVYVAGEHHGRGIGRRLYEELLARPQELEEILQEGARRARAVAREVLDEVRAATGISRRVQP